jgi:proteasome accessory factor C
LASGGAAERATRLLTLLPRLERGGRLSLADLGDELGVSADVLMTDLTLLSMCGVPPYSPDALVDVEVDGEEVVVGSDPPAIERRIRLTASEARALAAAMESCGVDASARTLQAALAGPEEAQLEAAVRMLLVPGPGEGSAYACVAGALERAEAIEIDYFTASRGETSRRTVLPLRLVNDAGEWYLHAFCTSVEGTRTFRLDRIESCRPTGETFERPADDGSEPVLFDPEGLPVAEVRFDPGEPDVDERTFPGASFEELDDGSTLARIPYGNPRWLARRVVGRLGRAAVVSPPDLQESVGSLAKSLSEAV